jgi:F-type H+-transporting ATPase subunit delta
MADSASVARPYAKAIFDLANEADSFDGWSIALAKLASISGDEQFSSLVADPRVEAVRISDLLVELVGDDLPEGGSNLISLLVKNERLGALSGIEQQFNELVAQAKASINAEVITAKALTDEQKAKLSAALEARLGLKVSLEETIDSALIGGAIVKAGDLVIDGSAKGRIEKLSTALLR